MIKLRKILVVFGTRPEAIKMVSVIKELKKYPDFFDVKVCVTAQHREMLDQVLTVFNLQPDFDLDLMAENQDLFNITTRVLLGIKDVLQEYKPDLALVHGDTTTSMAAAMAAFYMQIPVGHIEAGLRTYDLSSPWPEEMNRQVTDTISDYYFAPTESSRQNLIKEGKNDSKIFVTGNTVVDTLLMATNIIAHNTEIEKGLKELILRLNYDIAGSVNLNRKIILVTGHRRESFGLGFQNICHALKFIALKYPEVDIIYPVHLNPNVQRPVFKLLAGHSNIFLLPPLDYLPFVYLMQHCYMILSDSGGIQEEAPSLGKPVLVMRDTTERPEAVESGTVKLVGTSIETITENIETLLNNKTRYNEMISTVNPYGDGTASENIALFLKSISV
jgi:UDP-N-acetylglucosamine 2-epimerase (non-hydrolysing)